MPAGLRVMNYPAASSGVSKTTTGKTLRPKGRGIHPDGIKNLYLYTTNLKKKEQGIREG